MSRRRQSKHTHQVKSRKTSKPKYRFHLPSWITWSNLWQGLLPIRACFWGLNWFRWANTKFPKPEESEQDIVPILQTFLILALYFIAYAFYGSQQVTDLSTLFSNFLVSLKPITLLNISIFIIGLFIIYAYILRVSSRQLWAPLACIVLPIMLATVAFLFLFIRWVVAGDPTTNSDILMRLAAFWVMFSSLAGFVYILYRATKTRLNAYLMHPVLTPLIELTLAAKALDIALQGQATILTLPHIPSRLLIIALPVILVIYYLNRTLAAHREFLAKYKNTTTRQLAWSWQQFRNAGPIVGFWRVSGTATFRLGLALMLLFVAMIFFPATFSNPDILDETQIQKAIDAGKSR
jgi:hypothetical protein